MIAIPLPRCSKEMSLVPHLCSGIDYAVKFIAVVEVLWFETKDLSEQLEYKSVKVLERSIATCDKKQLKDLVFADKLNEGDQNVYFVSENCLM